MTDTYQGFTNRETWTVNLWSENEREHYDFLRKALAESDAALALQNHFDTWAWGLKGWPCDFALCVSDRVNWEEIVQHHKGA